MSAAGDQPTGRLRLLLDTNVVVAVEPYAGKLEANLGPAAQLVRLAGELGHVLCVAPANRDDVLQSQDQLRRQQRLAELKKFTQLAEVPISADLKNRAGDSVPGTNDHRDLRLLAALDAGAVQYLVTEDKAFYKRCRRAGHEEYVLTLAEALELLRSFLPPAQSTPPRVEIVPAYSLDTDDPIFESLRQDYPGFDNWLDKVRADSANRVCLVITSDSGYAGLAILKEEPDCELDLPKPTVKLSTFKISPAHGQNKLGELLLKAVFGYVQQRGISSVYVTAFDKHQALIALLASFGFVDTGSATELGELVLAKSFRPDEAADLDDLDFHVRYGPPCLRVQQNGFVVPIWPEWHDQLFPERVRTDQLGLFAGLGTRPWGNALRKAYLCNSATNQVQRGDVLLFYRSRGAATVCAVGIVDDVLRSEDPVAVSSFVGIRTVYSFEEITQMAGRVRGVLAITFRQDRFLEPEIALGELMLAGVLNSHPQQITRIPEEGMTWLRERLAESP